MRVLWVVKGLGPGGAEHLLAASARVHDRARVELACAYVLPYKDHLARDLEAAGVTTTCVSRRRRDWAWPWRLVRLVHRGGYDVIHVHSPLPGAVARLATRTMRSRPRVVVTEHNRWQTHRLPTRWINRWAGRWNDATFAVTAEVAESVRGAARRNLRTLRHGIEIDRVAAARHERRAVRTELGIGDDEIVVCTVANFRPQKDYPNLLAAARELADRGVPVRIVAVGQGPDERTVRARRDELGLSERVILTGFRPDAIRVLAASDAFVMASQWEGLPVALMEALALGMPVVATEVGGIAEELTHGVDALLVPPRDPHALAGAIERVATDPALRASLSEAAWRRAPDFDIGRSVAAYEDAYGPRDRQAAPAAAAGPPRRRRAAAPIDVRPAHPDDRPEILDLLGRSLGADSADPRYAALFRWKHDLNRFGPSPMWVATDAGRVVAVRALMRWEFERGGRTLRAVRAVDTATDPDYQGRGLFTTLTMHGLEELRRDEVDFVFNTPNAQSRPGYLKMGWRVVGRLPAAVRFDGPGAAWGAARARVPAERWSVPIDVGVPVEQWLAGGGSMARPDPVDVRVLRTRIDHDYLAWRFGGDLLGYRVVDDGDAAIIVRARRRGEATELALVAEFGSRQRTARLARRTSREVGADHVIRIGQPQMSSGWLPLPGGGPVLTWRGIVDLGLPPLSNWDLELGDVELF